MEQATELKQLEELKQRHSHLDGQLRVLTRRAHLTPTEQREAAILKKEKLAAKDQIRQLQSH